MILAGMSVHDKMTLSWFLVVVAMLGLLALWIRIARSR